MSGGRKLLLAFVVACALAPPAGASAASYVDVQANEPQVAGDPASDTTARFPTNKQNEPTIAVNPVNVQVLIAGSNDEQRQPACGAPPRDPADPADCSFFPGVGTDGVYTSSDGGNIWVNRGLLDDQPSWQSSPFVSDGDPVIVYGPKPASGGGFSYAAGARAYYVGLGSYKAGASPFSPQKAPEVILVSHSDDNGLTWSAPVVASTKRNPNTFNDKNSAWADRNPASPSFGNLYVGFTAFRSATVTGNGNEPIAVTRSTDGGQSFGKTNQLSAAGNNGTGNGRQGSDIYSGPDGTVYVAFEQGDAQVVAVSRDGGVKYSRPITVGPVSDIDDPIPGSNFRTDSFPSIAVDQTDGTVYDSWATKAGGVGRVVISLSTNHGASWSSPTVVSRDSDGYAFFNGLDVAPNGRIDIGYQAQKAVDSSTFGTGNALIDAYYVAGAKGGASYAAPVKVTSVSSDPAVSAQNNLQRQFWGDYNTVASTNARAYFIYTDGRNGQGCEAVDAYQRFFVENGIPTEPEEPGEDGAGENAPEDGDKPAPPVDCPAQFGNTDAYVSVITP